MILKFLSLLFLSLFELGRVTFDLSILPLNKPAREWTLLQAGRVRVVRLVLFYWSLFRWGDKLKLRAGREKSRFVVIRPVSPKLYSGPLDDALIKPVPIGLTWTPSPPKQPPSPSSKSSKAVVALHFHGGGFVIGDGRDHDTGFLARSINRYMGCAHVCTPQYRLSSSPNGQFPAALQDALTSYLYLLKDLKIPANQIIFSGDSAGGNMALGLLRYISEYGEALHIPAPRAVALWSPWVDVQAALTQDITTAPNYPTDYLNGNFARWGASTLTNEGAIDPLHPYISPLHHPFKMAAGGKTPMFIQTGDREVLFPDDEEFYKRFKNEGWDAELVVSKGCPHDILLLGPRMGFDKEATAAVKKAGDFFAKRGVISC